MSGTNWLDLMKDSQSAGGGFAPLPEGDYDLKVLEASATTTSTGKPMFKLKNEVQSGPHAKRLVWDNIVVSTDNPTALGFFFRKMKALGLDENFFATGPGDGQITSALTGRSFRGKISVRTWNGKDQNEIKEYYPVQGAPVAGGFTPGAPVAAPYAAPAPAPAPAPVPAAAPAPAPVAAAPDPWQPTVVPSTAPPAADPWAAAPVAPSAPPAGIPAPPAPPF